MFSTILGWMKLLYEGIQALMVLIGMIKKAEHEKEIKEIKQSTDTVGDTTKPEQERLDALEDLEKHTNSHT